MIKILVIAFIIWIMSGIGFLCWALCAASKMYDNDYENDKSKCNLRNEDEKDETVA